MVFGQRGNAELRARESRRERGALRWIHDAVTNASVTAAVAITSKVARRE